MRYHRTMMKHRVFQLLACLLLGLWAVQAQAQISTGVWWSTSQPGRGYIVEVSGSRALIGVLGYRSGGTSAWYSSVGSLFSSSVFSGDLYEYAGGQTLSGAARAPTSTIAVGTLSFTTTSATDASIILPGAQSLALKRYEFVGSGATIGRPSGAPETGWWWNANEPGRGYFIEVQGNQLFMLLMMYESDGTSRWYTATGSLVFGPFGLRPTMTATLEEYGGGPTLAGAYTTPSRTSTPGQITATFSSTTAGSIILPNGSTVALTRFSGF